VKNGVPSARFYALTKIPRKAGKPRRHRESRTVVAEVVTNHKTPGGIQNARWNTRSPVEYKITGGIQDHRWDTRSLAGYKTPGGIQEPRRDLVFLEEKSRSI
jgi:hypothetical protein